MIGFCGLELEHRIVNGSGTFDAIAARRAFGDALLADFPFAAFVSKTITLQPRGGNPPPRLYEVPRGLINSIGLPNKGLQGYLEHDLPQLAALPVPLITNVMGSTAGGGLRRWSRRSMRAPEVAAIELNVSCPNVKTGLDLGADPHELGALVGEVRPLTSKPLMVKLTPNTADVALVAQSAEAAGADAVSLINTLRAFAPHPDGSGAPWLGGGTGGPVGRGRPCGRAGTGRSRRAARRHPDRGDGGRLERFSRPPVRRCGRDARRGRDGELPRPGRRLRIRAELDEIPANSGVLTR